MVQPTLLSLVVFGGHHYTTPALDKSQGQKQQAPQVLSQGVCYVLSENVDIYRHFVPMKMKTATRPERSSSRFPAHGTRMWVPTSLEVLYPFLYCKRSSIALLSATVETAPTTETGGTTSPPIEECTTFLPDCQATFFALPASSGASLHP